MTSTEYFAVYARHMYLLGDESPLKAKVLHLLAKGNSVAARWGGKESGEKSLHRGTRTESMASQSG